MSDEYIQITPGDGPGIAVDQVDQDRAYQIVKIGVGADGVQPSHVSATNPMPITLYDNAGNIIGTAEVPLVVGRSTLTPLDDAQVTVGSTAVGLGTIPTGARFADVSLDGEIRYRVTGDDPTASVGQVESVGLLVDTPLADFKMIRTGSSDVTADVVFYS